VSMTTLPEQLRKTLTWDRGKELSAHAQFALDTGTRVFFADPHAPWQRPTNENTNGLLRQYFSTGEKSLRRRRPVCGREAPASLYRPLRPFFG
jgi:IS30 family transposase